MSETLVVNELFLSLQGESSWTGWPCVFVRLAGCNLRCSYCDTAYAFDEGRRMSLAEVRAEVLRLAGPFLKSPHTPPGAGHQRLPLVEVTGGEPLLQSHCLPLMRRLCDEGFTVLLETSGALDIAPVDPRVHRIMDLKCPGSGEMERNRWENLACLGPRDEIKFVIGTVEDYEWMKRVVAERGLAKLCPLLVSWAAPLLPEQRADSLKPAPGGHTSLTRRQLAERLLTDALPARFQLQMHKFIWPADQRGV